MNNPELGKTLEERESLKPRETLIGVAKDLLLDEGAFLNVDEMSDLELGEFIQRKFQENLEHFFETSGLAEEIKLCKTDEDALHLIANKGEGIHGWVDMLPNLIRSYPGAGMQCTMSSAMLHIALDKLELKGARTVSVKGHHVVLRELEDGSIKLYDAASKSTVAGKLVGYSQIFNPQQISDKSEVPEGTNRTGFQFTLDRGEQDDWGGFHMPDDEGKFKKKFYAYDPSIKMDICIALGNLSEIKDDAREFGGVKDLSYQSEEEVSLRHEQAKELVLKCPALQDVDMSEIVERFGIFTVDKYI